MISAVFAGCGKNGTGGAADGERAEKIAKEPKKISFLVPGYDGSDKDSYYTKAIKEFEKTYGKQVDFTDFSALEPILKEIREKQRETI